MSLCTALGRCRIRSGEDGDTRSLHLRALWCSATIAEKTKAFRLEVDRAALEDVAPESGVAKRRKSLNSRFFRSTKIRGSAALNKRYLCA